MAKTLLTHSGTASVFDTQDCASQFTGLTKARRNSALACLDSCQRQNLPLPFRPARPRGFPAVYRPEVHQHHNITQSAHLTPAAALGFHRRTTRKSTTRPTPLWSTGTPHRLAPLWRWRMHLAEESTIKGSRVSEQITQSHHSHRSNSRLPQLKPQQQDTLHDRAPMETDPDSQHQSAQTAEHDK